MSKTVYNSSGLPMTYDRTGDQLVLGIKCVFCKTEHKLKVTSQQFYDWQHGKLVQDAFPQLSPGEREMLITGMCDNCFPGGPEPTGDSDSIGEMPDLRTDKEKKWEL